MWDALLVWHRGIERCDGHRTIQPCDAHQFECSRATTARHECHGCDEACLPAGSVSGAPKVRAMQVIDEVEPHRRGPYAGAVGYLDYSGNMDTCIALRTLVFCNDRIYIQAGAVLLLTACRLRSTKKR